MNLSYIKFTRDNNNSLNMKRDKGNNQNDNEFRGM